MSTADETLRPESSGGVRRYIVTIVEESVVERHEQHWTQKGVDAEGNAHWGYVTRCTRKEEERTIFTGEFAQRPQISALAALMESSSVPTP